MMMPARRGSSRTLDDTEPVAQWRILMKTVTRWAIVLILVVGVTAVARTQQQPLKIRITDASGATVEVTSIDLDYSNYPGGIGWYTPDHERGGVRVKQGTGRVTVPWANIVALTVQAQTMYFVEQKDNAGRLEFTEQEKAKWEQARKGAASSGQVVKYTGQLQLASGTTSTVEILPVSKNITGKTELGDYAISISNVREIRPVK
jgi:hypothetical protein